MAAAGKAGMCEKTARKYRQSGKLPSQCKGVHTWRTRQDPVKEDDWQWVEDFLKTNPGLEAKTLFGALQREKPSRYQDGQLRTFQRRVRLWRALHGPGQEVFFPQIYEPGQWCESDFTRMKDLAVTIHGLPFDHMLYHFVLCWSNWETGNVCFSESYESLSAGLQNALWTLGGVPKCHRTDNLSSAVNKVGNPEVFTDNYRGLAGHYGFESHKIQPGCPHENGDVEQRHHRLKTAVDQALMPRGKLFPMKDIYIVRKQPLCLARARVFRLLSKLLHLCYCRIWYMRIAPKLPLRRRPLWRTWIRCHAFCQ